MYALVSEMKILDKREMNITTKESYKANEQYFFSPYIIKYFVGKRKGFNIGRRRRKKCHVYNESLKYELNRQVH